MSYASRGSGGGGGFGSFPYRGAHEQNNDGPAGRRRSKNRFQKRKQRGGALTCRALLKVPVARRRDIVGPKGRIVKELTERTRTVVDVPGARDPNSRVRIRGSCAAFVLHACWDISHLVLCSTDSSSRSESEHADDVRVHAEDDVPVVARLEDRAEHEEEHVEYELTIQGMDDSLKGKILRRGVPLVNLGKDVRHHDERRVCHTNAAFMVGQQTDACDMNGRDTSVSAYCVPIRNAISEDIISVWVDNERFSDSTITARVDVVPVLTTTGKHDSSRNESESTENGNDGQGKDHYPEDALDSMLVFIYGTSWEQPEHLYSVISQRVAEYDNNNS